MLQERLKKYAQLAVKVGIHVQKGQPVVLGYWHDPVLPEHVEFARLLVEAAYDAGASFVHVNWGDEWWTRETVRRGDLSFYEQLAADQAAYIEKLAEQGAAFLRIPASDPDLYAGLDATRVGQADRMLTTAFNPFNFRRTNGEYSWSLVSAPTQVWADKVHSELPEDQRVDALWEDILYCARATGDDPVADWKNHLLNLGKRKEWLNSLHIASLHYKAPGTDLTIALPKEHFFAGAGDKTSAGAPYVANIPTEEVFSAPIKTGVHGVVTSTMPLNHNGALIDGFTLEFENGRIVKYSAKKGHEALQNIIETDEGSHYLGEVALVPVSSPIATRGVLFYNTLFDENASCHLAIGKAYPLIKGGRQLNREDWEKHGLNDSLMHVDFMIGSKELTITAITQSGDTVKIFEHGEWAHAL